MDWGRNVHYGMLGIFIIAEPKLTWKCSYFPAWCSQLLTTKQNVVTCEQGSCVVSISNKCTSQC